MKTTQNLQQHYNAQSNQAAKKVALAAALVLAALQAKAA